jgi:hypothetical protein
MTERQIEELAKLYLDLGKLVFASLVLGFFQSNLQPTIIYSYGLLGLTISLGLFIMGLRLLK